jgi:hypothetical protein
MTSGNSANDLSKSDPSDEYKNLQRQLETERQARREAQRQATAARQDAAQLNVTGTLVRDLAKAVMEGGDGEEIEAMLQSHETNTKAVASAGAHLTQISDMLEDTELDWDDSDELSAARTAWSENNFAQAAREVEKLVGDSGLEEKIARGIQAHLKKEGVMVDSGSSSAREVSGELLSDDAIVSDPGAAIDKMAADMAKLLQ